MSQAGIIDINGSPDVPTQFDTDSGSAVPVLHVLEVFGDNGITTEGSGNTVTILGVDATTSQVGVVELATSVETISGSSSTLSVVPSGLNAKLGDQTANAVPYGQGSTSAIGWTDALTDGQLVIGATGSAPAVGVLTSSDSSINIALGANTIDLTSGSTSVEQFDADSGSANPSSGIMNFIGTSAQGISSSASGNTVTYTIDDATTSQKGVLETSTDAESIAGTSTTVGVTPASLAAKLGDQTANGVAYGAGTTSALSWTAVGTDGQVLLAATSGAPAFATLTSTGSTIDFTLGANSLNLETGSAVATSFLADDTNSAIPSSGVLTVTGSGGIVTSASGSTLTIDGSAITDFDWNVATGSTQAVAVNNGYFANYNGTLAFTLPSTAAVGDTMQICQMFSSQGWSLAQNAGQTCYIGNQNTTTGVGGSLTSTDDGDWIEIVCRVADTDFQVNVKSGNITIT